MRQKRRACGKKNTGCGVRTLTWKSGFPISVAGSFSPIRSISELKSGRVIQKADGDPHLIHYRSGKVLTVDALMSGEVFGLGVEDAKRSWKIHPHKFNKEMQSFRRHRLGISPIQKLPPAKKRA